MLSCCTKSYSAAIRAVVWVLLFVLFVKTLSPFCVASIVAFGRSFTFAAGMRRSRSDAKRLRDELIAPKTAGSVSGASGSADEEYYTNYNPIRTGG